MYETRLECEAERWGLSAGLVGFLSPHLFTHVIPLQHHFRFPKLGCSLSSLPFFFFFFFFCVCSPVLVKKDGSEYQEDRKQGDWK